MSGTPSGRTPTLPAPPAFPPIDGRFVVDGTRPLPGAGGGLPSFVAEDRTGRLAGLMAVETRPDALPRAATLGTPLGDLAGVLVPLAHGPARGQEGRADWFVVCPAPPGPALWPEEAGSIAPWTEADLLRLLIVPVAAALEAMRLRGLTHRAIRPGNLFRADAAAPVVLGCAWATPPAYLQPAAFEPPYAAMCLPGGRGEGSVADDIYALGVTALALALGRMPWAALPGEEVIHRVLVYGGVAALAGEARLPGSLADLLRVMLAEDPGQRPPPDLLRTPLAAASRRIGTRPPRRAQRALSVGGIAAWDARTLAYAIARDPAAGARVLRSGLADHWLRRSVDDGSLAVRLEEPLQRRQNEAGAEDAGADALLALRAVALLDPLAPLCWGGVAVWPDGLGTALAAHDAPQLPALVREEATAAFAALRGPVEEAARLRQEARARRALLERRGWAGGPARLRYALNPLLPCRSRTLSGAQVVRLADLVPALEAAVARRRPTDGAVLDAELVAFIAARQDGALESLLAPFADGMGSPRAAVMAARLLGRLQAAFATGPLPALAGVLAEAARPDLDSWRSRSRRAEKAERLAQAAAGGDLAAMLAVLDDPAARAAEAAEWQEAQAAAAAIDARIAALVAGDAARTATARALGREIAAGLGLAALAASGVAVLLG